MLMKKFLGATAREAMQKMKAELGPDALVISNRKTSGGVEILAMVEAEQEPASHQAQSSVAAEAAAKAPAPRRASVMAAPAAPRAMPAPAQSGRFTSLLDFAARIEAPASRSARPAATHEASHALQRPDWQVANTYAAHEAPSAWPAARGRGAHGSVGAAAGGEWVATPSPAAPTAPAGAVTPVASEGSHGNPFAAYATAAGVPAATLARAAAPAVDSQNRGPTRSEQRMFDELAAMKSMLQSQIAGLAWRDMAERRPLAVRLWREMVEAGFSASLARTVADKLPDDHNEAQARKWLADVLARNIRCADPAREMVESGGVFALVGPTGVGKTTTTAKLAARCVVKYGALSLGLVTTDSYRIGAFDQLAIYGKILGVPVHSAQSYGELEATIATMASKRLVLIDTTGMGQRDNRVAEQINLLNNPSIKRVLLLNAAVQAETLDDVARAYQGKSAGARPLAGAILTKIDEAAKLAPALDVVARHSLELLHVTNGQRVPEDLHAPTSSALVHRALKALVDPAFALRDNEVAARAMRALAPLAGADQGSGRGEFAA